MPPGTSPPTAPTIRGTSVSIHERLHTTPPTPAPPPVETDRVDIADLDEPTTWIEPPELAVVSHRTLPTATPTCNCWLRKDIQCLLSLGCYTEQTLRERFHIEPTERILIKLSYENIPGHRPLAPGEDVYVHDGTVISLLVERPRAWSETAVP